MISIFGIIAPSVDQATDYYTTANLINIEHPCRSPGKDYCSLVLEGEVPEEELRVRRYGYAMLVPIGKSYF